MAHERNSSTLGFSTAMSGIKVQVNQTGSYQVLINDKTWLSSGATSFQFDGKHHSTADGTLKLVGPESVQTGLDAFGKWAETSFQYAASMSTSTMMTAIKTYSEESVAIFSQV